ncbi:hypothetical protein BT69DRAFT_1284898 [Atractiella rhizophila]|nr:hypothetical protein BT69DRAFT_1284898 [Atractiella rhizophila]
MAAETLDNADGDLADIFMWYHRVLGDVLQFSGAVEWFENVDDDDECIDPQISGPRLRWIKDWADEVYEETEFYNNGWSEDSKNSSAATGDGCQS